MAKTLKQMLIDLYLLYQNFYELFKFQNALRSLSNSYNIYHRLSPHSYVFSFIISKSKGLNIYKEHSLCLYIWLKGSESSEAEIIVQGAKWFQSKSDTVPMCPIWSRIMLFEQLQSASQWFSKLKQSNVLSSIYNELFIF